MINNNLDILFEELSDTFEDCIKNIVKGSKYSEIYAEEASESSISRYRNDAKEVVEKYEKGLFIDNKGRLIDGKGKFLDEADDPKDITLYSTELTMDNYVSGEAFGAGFCCAMQEYLPLSFVCYQWGTHQYHKDKKAEGRKFLIYALKFVYMWSGAVELLRIKYYEQEQKQNKINAASKGGKAKAKKYDQIKTKVIELLKKRVPEGGWKTKAAAIEALSSDFEDSWDKMHRTIEDWSRNDKEIKSVFAEVVQKK